MLKINLSAIICLLASLYFALIASGPCINKKVQVEVRNGIRLTGDWPFKPDIYVVLRLGDQTHKTITIDSTSSPAWWKMFTFDPDPSHLLTIEVWDEDSGLRGKDDLLTICNQELMGNTSRKDVICFVPGGGLVNLQYSCK